MASRTATAPWPARGGPFLIARWCRSRPSGAGGAASCTGCALDKGADRGLLQPDDQVALPVPGDGPVVGLGGRWLIIDLVGDEDFWPFRGPRAGLTQRPSGPQARGQLALERAAALHVERLVDRLVADPHRLIIGEVDPQPVADLLRAPGHRPPPVVRGAASGPRHVRTRRRSLGVGDLPGEPVLDVGPQPSGSSRAWPSWAASPPAAPSTAPPRPGSRAYRAGRGVATQLARDRRRVAPDPAGDLTHPMVLRLQEAISSRSAKDRYARWARPD